MQDLIGNGGLSQEELKTLLEIGFLLTAHGHVVPGEKVFDAIGRVRPGNEAVTLGRSMLLLQRGRPDEAADLLERCVMAKDEPDLNLVLALGVAQHAAGRSAQSERSMADAMARERAVAADTATSMEKP